MGEGGPRPVLPSFLPQRPPLHGCSVNPPARFPPPLPPVHFSVLLTLLFVLHLAPEHRGVLARRPRPPAPAQSHSLQERRREGGTHGEDEERRRRRRRRADDGAAAAVWIHQCWRHTWTDADAWADTRGARRSGLSRLRPTVGRGEREREGERYTA